MYFLHHEGCWLSNPYRVGGKRTFTQKQRVIALTKSYLILLSPDQFIGLIAQRLRLFQVRLLDVVGHCFLPR